LGRGQKSFVKRKTGSGRDQDGRAIGNKRLRVDAGKDRHVASALGCTNLTDEGQLTVQNWETVKNFSRFGRKKGTGKHSFREDKKPNVNVLKGGQGSRPLRRGAERTPPNRLAGFKKW